MREYLAGILWVIWKWLREGISVPELEEARRYAHKKGKKINYE